MRILFKNAYSCSDILNIKPDFDVVSVNYYQTICFADEIGVPVFLRATMEVGRVRKIDILLHSRVIIDGEDFLATFFIHNGKISGISESLTNEKYARGNALRTYKIGGIRAGLVIDSDMLHSGVDNLFYSGAKVLFHNSLGDFNSDYFGAYKSHARLCQGIRVGLFRNCAVVYDDVFNLVEDKAEINVNSESKIYNCKAFLCFSKDE